jgi:membrane fusion protein (multidrug efflux system)
LRAARDTQTFALQNATGNWVKVVQRVPVRLQLIGGPEPLIQAGLSADVTVDTHSHDHAYDQGVAAMVTPAGPAR